MTQFDNKLIKLLRNSTIIVGGSYSDHLLYGKENFKDVDLIFRSDNHLLKYFPDSKIVNRTCIYNPLVKRRAINYIDGILIDCFIIKEPIPFFKKDGINHITLDEKIRVIKYTLNKRLSLINKEKNKLKYYKKFKNNQL